MTDQIEDNESGYLRRSARRATQRAKERILESVSPSKGQNDDNNIKNKRNFEADSSDSDIDFEQIKPKRRKLKTKTKTKVKGKTKIKKNKLAKHVDDITKIKQSIRVNLNLDDLPVTSLTDLINDRFENGKLSKAESIRREEIKEARKKRFAEIINMRNNLKKNKNSLDKNSSDVDTSSQINDDNDSNLLENNDTLDPFNIGNLADIAINKILDGETLTESESFALSQSKLVQASLGTRNKSQISEGNDGNNEEDPDTILPPTSSQNVDKEDAEAQNLQDNNENNSEDEDEDDEDEDEDEDKDEDESSRVARPKLLKDLSSINFDLDEEENIEEENIEEEITDKEENQKGKSIAIKESLETKASIIEEELSKKSVNISEEKNDSKPGSKSISSTGGTNVSTIAPRLVIVDGVVQLDKASLFVPLENPEMQEYDQVDEGTHRYVTAASFSTRKRTGRVRWTPEMTDRFYIGLSLFGTNFHLISLLFPELDRSQILLKFRAEEKIHSKRITQAIKNRKPIPSELLDFIKSAKSN